MSTVVIKLFPTYMRRKQWSREGQVSRALCPEQCNAQQKSGVQGTLALHFKEFLLLKQPSFLLTEALVVVRYTEILKGLYMWEWRQGEPVPSSIAIGHGCQWPVW